jgi:hypothetical protein
MVAECSLLTSPLDVRVHALGPTERPIQQVPNHSYLSSAKVMKEWSGTSIPPVCFHGMDREFFPPQVQSTVRQKCEFTFNLPTSRNASSCTCNIANPSTCTVFSVTATHKSSLL